MACNAGHDGNIPKPVNAMKHAARTRPMPGQRHDRQESDALTASSKSADESREYAEGIISTVREPLIVLDQDLHVVTASRPFYDVFMLKPEETMGQLIYDLDHKQWDIPKLRELLETLLPRTAAVDNYTVVHTFAASGRHTMLLNARQFQGGSGQRRSIVLAIEDITERKEIEAGWVKTYEELFESATEAKRIARIKSEFLANMQHELRTPFNSINGFSEILFDETFGPLNGKQKQYITNILVSGKHLLMLINQILDMAQVESGNMKLALSVITPEKLLREIAQLAGDMAIQKGLHLKRDIAGDLPTIEADELKLKAIIYGLLSNAVKFTAVGGTIGLRAVPADPGIEIVVWDTGIGIEPGKIEKILEGFSRAEPSYARTPKTRSLGLPLSKKLVELHGGKFSVESAGLNLGTSIRLTLPIIPKKGGV